MKNIVVSCISNNIAIKLILYIRLLPILSTKISFKVNLSKFSVQCKVAIAIMQKPNVMLCKLVKKYFLYEESNITL